MDRKKIALIAIAGFASGALVGFAWSSGAKSRMSESVTTEFSRGKLTVQVDMKKAIVGGVKDYL